MAVQSATNGVPRPRQHYRNVAEDKRASRWHFFQLVFGLTYLGILLDIVTSWIGFQQMGSSYEQNPLAKALILNIGWAGLTLLLTATCAVCYVSFRAVYARMNLRWTVLGNVLIVIVALMRWVVAGTALIFIVFPIH